MSVFKASVQYGDFKGTVAADCSDDVSMSDYLKEQGIVSGDCVVIGYRVIFNENPGEEIEKPGIVVYVCDDINGGDPEAIDALEIDLTAAQFFKFFKRFDLVMTSDGHAFNDEKVRGPFYD